MAAVISLEDVIEALEFANEQSRHYLDPETGEIVLVTDEDRSIVERKDEQGFDDLPDWQKESLPKIVEALESGRFLELPDAFDIHEWSIMERFAQSCRNARLRDELLRAIHHSGAFRAFKSTLHRAGVEQDWYKYRQQALKQIARDWLDEHKLPYK